MIKIRYDPPDTPHPSHRQRYIFTVLVGRKGSKAYREVMKKVNLTDITTATKSQLDELIALMSEYPDLEAKWRKRKLRR